MKYLPCLATEMFGNGEPAIDWGPHPVCLKMGDTQKKIASQTGKTMINHPHHRKNESINQWMDWGVPSFKTKNVAL